MRPVAPHYSGKEKQGSYLNENSEIRTSPILITLLVAGLLTATSSETFAQNVAPAQDIAAAPDVQAAQARALAQQTARTPEKTKGDFVANNARVWNAILAQCGTVDAACANAAVFAASAECEDSAKFFRKGTKGWQIFSIVLTLTSASFTGVGASTTLSNAKVFSTLGGSTGLAAVVPTLNANATGDQTGMTTVASTIAKLQAYALGTGSPPTPPTAAALFQQARLYGATCASAANASPANNSSAPSK
jgi:hypothetical protein